MCKCVFRFFFNITAATEDKVHVGPPRDRVENYSNGSGILYFNFVCPSGVGPFSGDFTTNLARQCRAFSRALKIES